MHATTFSLSCFLDRRVTLPITHHGQPELTKAPTPKEMRKLAASRKMIQILFLLSAKDIQLSCKYQGRMSLYMILPYHLGICPKKTLRDLTFKRKEKTETPQKEGEQRIENNERQEKPSRGLGSLTQWSIV